MKQTKRTLSFASALGRLIFASIVNRFERVPLRNLLLLRIFALTAKPKFTL